MSKLLTSIAQNNLLVQLVLCTFGLVVSCLYQVYHANSLMSLVEQVSPSQDEWLARSSATWIILACFLLAAVNIWASPKSTKHVTWKTSCIVVVALVGAALLVELSVGQHSSWHSDQSAQFLAVYDPMKYNFTLDTFDKLTKPQKLDSRSQATFRWDSLHSHGCCGLKDHASEWPTKTPKSCCVAELVRHNFVTDEFNCTAVSPQFDRPCMKLITRSAGIDMFLYVNGLLLLVELTIVQFIGLFYN